MADENDIPQTFREVGIYLRDIRDDQQNLKSEVDEIKKGQARLLGILFTSIIAPIIVAIILVYVLGPSR